MAPPKQPAIDLEAVGQKTLSEVSAADFLTALGTGGMGAMRALKVWPEKKKVELYLEPENLTTVRVRDVINVVTEKKKVELEKPPGVEFDAVKSSASERIGDFRELIRDPEFIGQLAKEVAAQLRGMR